MGYRSTVLVQFVKAIPQVVGFIACYGRTKEWGHPLFSAAETKGGSTSLAMTFW
jgi:hypothetical protein